ncbi:dTDP-4-dehydrorhamnose reductase [Cohaesibacter sp. ES.047]|uniref:dTDP-4-dehydrorhamnose reductase n=1 Tax=Cohaesibacter sp. ES.047 TaxID=1798205 RepID=UPI000BB7BE4C|nr:dTDP-4-dehydrorhamnose reductase [Cohaesibacter sp. ES.047]SNY89878.1 dTDP-4-dehydrorhamnose reductase [Cohaesibacter sp. ES.047]SNY91702.1 dTDP-4-dehydrorhamnose reductase [Cohaesibacter sp. ES.047]
MRLAVTGKNGQVSQALQGLNLDDLEVVAIGRPEMDLTDAESVRAAIDAAKADTVVSAAAYTAVDAAESEPDLAFANNRDGAGAVAAAAASLNIPVLHLSTDYVFDGTLNRAYIESDPTGPATIYGRSKLDGEEAVARATDNHAIFRTAWVYSPYGKNFVKTMLRLAETRDSVGVVGDQFGCPTSARDIAEALVSAARQMLANSSQGLRGIFHMSGHGETSWADFAAEIFDALYDETGKRVMVTAITTADYPTPAKRPANSRLDCGKLEAEFGIRMPNWQASTREVVRALISDTGGAS